MLPDHQFPIDEFLPQPGTPDFRQLHTVLTGGEPDRPTLFEFFLNDRLHQRLSGLQITPGMSWLDHQRVRLRAFQRAGYDYLTVLVPGFDFPTGAIHHAQSVSQNEGALVHDRDSFSRYPWKDASQTQVDWLERLAESLPDGMKIIVHGPGGVLENAIALVGYENLCLLIMDDPALALDLFAEIGQRLNAYYARTSRYDFVGACISNDDWGFKTQTLFSPRAMRKYVFPWHKQIAETIHAAGKPAILHSCGNFSQVLEDVIDEMGYDARHSYEDTIMPVEQAYEDHHHRLAILGGIDVDFICRSTPEQVYQRSRKMLERSRGRGAYALGTGNSVPEYVPDAGYFAMIRAALELR
ncbi:MAG: hypothetical protein HPY85_00035 [Anaerolineae bacterium]|nr:hypothetical protein [Anaerolineae bacterium]